MLKKYIRREALQHIINENKLQKCRAQTGSRMWFDFVFYQTLIYKKSYAIKRVDNESRFYPNVTR